MSQQYRIILVDDHEMVRAAFKELIERSGPYVVTQEYASGKELVQAKKEIQDADLMVLDLSMPVMDGWKVVDWMQENNIELKTLVVTMESDDDWIASLFRKGIRGYLRKQSPSSELKKAMESILDHGYYHNEIFNTYIMAPETKRKAKEDIMDRISDKELQFLKLVCDEEEYTYEQMTSLMNVHRRTLDNYRESLFQKFNIKSKSGLVMFAIKHKLVG